MRHTRIISLMLVLLLLSGCGQESVSSLSSAAEATMNPLDAATLGIEDAEPVETEISWEKIDLMDEAYGYILSETDFSTIHADFPCHETTVFLESEQETDRIPLVRQAVDGTELERIWLPRPQDEMSDYTGAIMLADCVWAVRRDKSIVDQETGEWTAAFTLEQWDKNEALLCSVPIDENFCTHPEDVFNAALNLSPQGDLLVGLDEGLYRLDDSGTITGFLDYQGKSYSTCRNREGELYLEDGSGVYPIDWYSFTLGQPLFSISVSDILSPGSGPYDFFLRGSKSLKGINIQEGTISTILNWSDWSLTTPANVIYLDGNTLLVSVYGVFSQGCRYITMERVPISEIPEKNPIHLAVGVDKRLADQGVFWQDCSDLEDYISDFNLTNGTYEIQVSPFSTANELNLLMLEDNPPDAIYWNASDKSTLKDSYIKKGYLTDLTDYFQQDQDLTLDHFFPQLVEAATASDGCIYAMPSFWKIETLMGRQDLTGTNAGWSFEEFFAAADALPEGTALQYTTALGGLYGLLSYTLDQFIDYQNHTCDFTGNLFQSLLTFCKEHYYKNTDQIPESEDIMTSLTSGDLMLHQPAIFNPAYFAEELPNYTSAGLFLVGFPGLGGSGVAGIPSSEYSITTLGDQAEGAWAFLQKIYSSDFQGSFMGSNQGTVRTDCLEAAARNKIGDFSMNVDEESFQFVLELYDNAVAVFPAEPDLLDIITEEAQAYFAGDKTSLEVGEIINNRIFLYLSEQS